MRNPIKRRDLDQFLDVLFTEIVLFTGFKDKIEYKLFLKL